MFRLNNYSNKIDINYQITQINTIKITKNGVQNLISFSIINLNQKDQKMQEKDKTILKLKCPEGNQAVFACANFQCSKSSLICQVKQCQCRGLHHHCITLAELSKLILQLENKGRSYSIILDEIYQWYETQLKLIKIEMEQLKGIIDKKEVVLLGNQQRLYTLLTEQKSQLIIPQLVSYVLKSIEKEPVRKDVQEKMQQVKKQLGESDKEFKTMLEKVNKVGDNKLKFSVSEVVLIDDIKFSYDLHHPNLSHSNAHTIKVTNYVGSWVSAFIEPAIFRNKHKSSKVSFKINQVTTNYLIFGVCQIPTNLKITDINIYNLIQCGSLVYYNDNVYLGKNQGHRKESINIAGYANNDLIQVEYQQQTQKITVKNITKNTSSVSYIKTQTAKPIYFVVLLLGANDSVEIIDGKYYQ